MSATTLNQILCRQCTAPLDVEAGSTLVTCGFCGTTNQVDKSQVILHYAVEPTMRQEDAAAALRRWMAGNDTIKGLDQKAEIVSRRYELFPLWMVNAVQQEEERRFMEPAAATSVSVLKELTVPASDLKSYAPEMDDVAVEATVPFRMVLEWLRTEHGVDAGAIRAAAIVHVPLYVFKYRYGDETYVALVDAASGRVMANLFPTKREVPYLLLGGLAFVLNFCAATIPIIGYGVDGGAGFIGGLLIYLLVAAVMAVPIFGVAAVVSARA
jgi:LSD1 subclass zinc finger protein